jgi:subtilisin family serine protease
MRIAKIVALSLVLALGAVLLGGAASRNALPVRALPVPVNPVVARPVAGLKAGFPGRVPVAAPGAAAPRTGRPRATSLAGKGLNSRRAFAEIDLTARTKQSAVPDTAATAWSPALRARLAQLTDPFFLRPEGAAPVSPAGARRPAADKDLPWAANTLLANPSNMNDDHVTLATSPDGNTLYASFTAVDLGATDRDVYVARSLNQGVTWQAWKLPSFTQDEYQPELAVDGGGYLHVAWIRDDGTILRSRSANPGDPSAWAWVKGLAVGEPCAVPSLAVTGAGDFAKVFIAANWLTVNYDYYQYEWTLIFMYSSNGGNTVTYDYFLPDGYPDYWPDVAMNAGTVHFVNAEEDADTGEMEILIATDAYTGSFANPASFTGWTTSNAGYPRVACEGANVYVAYQLDYSDGITSDGDIIYTYSSDAGTSFYGPYGLVADEYDSVGPTLFVRGGIVGCAWLDAPAGGDEFQLATRLASAGGAADYFGDVEMVTDAPRVEPVFHAAAGVFTATRAHAAWSDRRDFATQGRNIYNSRRDLRPNLAPFVPTGWDSALVVNVVRGQRHDGYVAAGDTNWVSFAFLNDGLRDITARFYLDLEVDGQPVASWRLDGGLPAGTYVPVEDFPLPGPLGDHVLSVRLDPEGLVTEDTEADNDWSRAYTFRPGAAQLRFWPTRLVSIINPYLKRADALALAQDPPLRRETWLDPVDERLAAAMGKATGGGRLPVVIVPAERLDPTALGLALKDATRATRREVLTLAAREQTQRSLAALQPTLDALAASGDAADVRALWLPGLLAADLSPTAVAALAADPRVARLWLDDVPCEPYGAPATAGPDGTLTVADPAAADAAPGLKAGEKALAWHLTAIGADRAWAAGSTGAGVLVGHLDSGLCYDHPDLANHLWDGGASFPHHGWDAVDNDNDPYDGDTSWHHGTHTAGLIVGDGTGGTRTGVAPGARVMALRVVPGYLTDLVEGMQFGIDHGVQLFSMSAGWSQATADVRAANRNNAELLLAIDLPWVAAAGNGSPTGHYALPTDISSPADCPGPWYAPNGGRTAMITVGGLTSAGTVESSSSYGPTAWNLANPNGGTDYHDYPYPPGLLKPDLAAPGNNVTSLSGASGYVAYTGTSMACPQVAGAVAILLGAAPGLTPAQLAEALESTATDITAAPATVGRDRYSGAGRIDIPAALAGVPTGTSLEFTLQNTGDLPLVFRGMWDGDGWLDADQPPAFLDPGASARLSLRLDPTGLPEGVHDSYLTFLTNAPDSPQQLPVQLLYGDFATGVDPVVPAPARPALAGYPNPFNPRVTLRFALPADGPATLEIHDLAGRLVRRLLDGPLTAGDHEAVWDGRDDDGRAVASGQYLARLRAADAAPATRKLTLVR